MSNWFRFNFDSKKHELNKFRHNARHSIVLSAPRQFCNCCRAAQFAFDGAVVVIAITLFGVIYFIVRRSSPSQSFLSTNKLPTLPFFNRYFSFYSVFSACFVRSFRSQTKTKTAKKKKNEKIQTENESFESILHGRRYILYLCECECENVLRKCPQ